MVHWKHHHRPLTAYLSPAMRISQKKTLNGARTSLTFLTFFPQDYGLIIRYHPQFARTVWAFSK